MHYLLITAEVLSGLLVLAAILGPVGLRYVAKQIKKSETWLKKYSIVPPKAMRSREKRTFDRKLYQAYSSIMSEEGKDWEDSVVLALMIGIISNIKILSHIFSVIFYILKIIVNLLVLNPPLLKENSQKLWKYSRFLISIAFDFVTLFVSFLQMLCRAGIWIVSSLDKRIFVGIVGIISYVLIELFLYGVLG